MTQRTRICVVLGSGITLLSLIIGVLLGYFDAGPDSERVAITASQISFLVSLVAFVTTISLIVISLFRSSRTRSAEDVTPPPYGCPACGGDLEPSNRVFGKRLTCSKCGKVVRLDSSPMRAHILVVFALFVVAIHPILVALLGVLIAAMFGLEGDGPGFKDHFVAGVNVSDVCGFLIGYHWMGLASLPLMLIVIPYFVVLLIWGAVRFVRDPQATTEPQAESVAGPEITKPDPPVASVTRIRCPKCEKSIRVPNSMRGKSGKCPGCGTRINIPLLQPTN